MFLGFVMLGRARHLRFRVTVVAAVSALVVATPVSAEEGFHPLDSTLEFMGLKTRTGPMPNFVDQSHKDTAAESYMPVGVKPTDRALKPKTAAEVKAATADLDAARAAQLAGKRPRPLGAGPAKAPLRKTVTTR